MKLSELASSFRCDKFEDYTCKNGTLNTKNAEIINDELIMYIFKIKPELMLKNMISSQNVQNLKALT